MKIETFFYRHKNRTTVLLIMVVCLVMGAIIFFNSFHRSVKTGDVLAADDLMSQVFRIEDNGVEKANDHYILWFSADGEIDFKKLAIAAFRTKQITFYDEKGVPCITSGADAYQHFRLLPLEQYIYDAQSGLLRIEWSVEDFFNPNYMFIGSLDELETQSKFWGRMRDISLGILFLMLIYSLSLFAYKREEKYLSSFAVYIVVTLLMTILNMGFIESDWLYDLYSKIVPILIMAILCVEVATICRLLNVRKCWWTKCFFSWKWIAVISLLYYGVSMLDSMFLREISRLSVIIAGFAVVVVALVDGTPHALVIFLGYAVSEAINLVPIGINMGLYEDGLPLALFRTGRLYGLPFAFCCMFFINWKFANRFKETELLSSKLEETNRSLDQIVQERTAATISQMQKRHSLMLNIFHDLRSPLFILKGCLQILSDENEADPEDQKETHQIAQEKLEFMSDLTERLFLLAKLEDDNFLLSCTRLNAGALVKKLVPAYRIAAEQKAICLIEMLEVDDAFVWGDRMRLDQAFDNILNNALRYTPAGGRITVGAERRNETIVFSIEDTGIGIPLEQQETIFERYYRADSTAKPSSGLGLAIARGIVQKHNGSILVNSTVGKGTTFFIVLPLLESKPKLDRK